MSEEKESEDRQEDRLTYRPGDLEVVSVGDGPPTSAVEEERRRTEREKKEKGS